MAREYRSTRDEMAEELADWLHAYVKRGGKWAALSRKSGGVCYSTLKRYAARESRRPCRKTMDFVGRALGKRMVWMDVQ